MCGAGFQCRDFRWPLHTFEAILSMRENREFNEFSRSTYNRHFLIGLLPPLVAFSALMLFVGWQESIQPVKTWVMRCWRGYLPGARCKWLVYSPADATATPSSLLQKNNPEWFVLRTSYPGKKAVKQPCVCVFHPLVLEENLGNSLAQVFMSRCPSYNWTSG